MTLSRPAEYSDVFSALRIWYGSIARSKANPADADIPIAGSFAAGHAFADHHWSSYHKEAEDAFGRSVHLFSKSVSV